MALQKKECPILRSGKMGHDGWHTPAQNLALRAGDSTMVLLYDKMA
jgi:hypothetical protein